MERQYRESPKARVTTAQTLVDALGECFLMFVIGYIVADALRYLLFGVPV